MGNRRPVNGDMIEGVKEEGSTASYKVDRATVCFSMGVDTMMGKKVFTDDICFVESDDIQNGEVIRENRLFFICKWIEDWAMFVWMDLNLLEEFEDCTCWEEQEECMLCHGVLNRGDYDDFVLDSGVMHYFGNRHDFATVGELFDKVELFD